MLFDRLANAIATAEGFFVSGSLPAVNHNPGDLRASSLDRPKDRHGFVVFKSDEEGVAALYRQIALDVARGVSLRQLVYKWAPPSDGNDSENYVRETARRAQVGDVDKPLWNYLTVTKVA